MSDPSVYFPSTMKRPSFPGSIEALESRIAPARLPIITGVPDVLGNDVNYDESPFINTDNGVTDPTDHISKSVGPGVVGVADTFYLRLVAGDILQVYNTTNGPENYLEVKSGNVVAFFVDRDADNEVDPGELVSMAIGKNAAFVLKGGLDGDIVSNLDERGTPNTADDLLDMAETGVFPAATGLVSAAQGVKSMLIEGDLVGNLLVGGNITNITVNGGVGGIFAGKAADGKTFDFFPAVTGGNGQIDLGVRNPAFSVPGAIGSSISKVTVFKVGTSIEAGAGGAGGNGGSLNNIEILADNDGLTLEAGAGGDFAGTKINGGLGGSISSVYVSGAADNSANSLINLEAGAGGNSAAGTGGKGGAISTVFVGYQLLGGKTFVSGSLLADNVNLTAGSGGAGKIGGAGGAVSNIDLLVVTPDVVAAGTDEINVLAGNGGSNLIATGGKAGAGGSIAGVKIRNQLNEDVSTGQSILVQAGSAGTTVAGLALGGAGGSIATVNLLSNGHQVLAGNGSDGKIGGLGGSLKTIVIEQTESIFARSAVFNAGFGGVGTAGNGGNGGIIDNVRTEDGDFTVLEINSGGAGNGGNSTGGKGGNGGLVTHLDILDTGIGNSATSTFNLHTGTGGNGSKGGGSGGSLISAQFTGLDLNIAVQTGSGGNATSAGNGGFGGLMSVVELVGDNSVSLGPVTGTVTAGSGGVGAGATGAGGVGGGVRGVDVHVSGAVNLTAGNGGAGTGIVGGPGGAAGKGGSIITSAAFAQTGAGLLRAGDAGSAGARAGVGGSITGASTAILSALLASTDLTIRAGDGSQGGAGGALKFVGYGSSAGTLLPTPSGNITIQAGNGSSVGKLAGAGGSIDSVFGSVSSGSNKLSQILAGDVIGTGTTSAAGGSISNLDISRGGIDAMNVLSTNSFLVVEAGDAGGTAAARGGKGGDVRTVTVSDIGGTLFRSVAAGNGSDATTAGGLGGSVKDVHVVGFDIGDRTGSNYGYATMGGVFAGAGGKVTSMTGKVGKAGNVSIISANSIAAIVAGRTATPEAVESVSVITVVAGDKLLHESQGAFMTGTETFNSTYYGTANFVGAIADLTQTVGWQFRYTDTNTNATFDLGDSPIDGVIVANKLDQKTLNFTPEAKLILEDTVPFYDFDNKI